ncbi:hypothetical protein EVAR_33421_1 [Eumeta japonica]|uniref:Uncharacterized protein n=1 Tax=Eumeta variegata TaxID=151549 RepID=A0A4C1W1P7_EUMVA|nr:hypothetical protein EVAR_33421_1 [Eumeta japonica]
MTCRSQANGKRVPTLYGVFNDAGESGGCVEGSGSGGEAGDAGETGEGAVHTFGPLDGSIYATVVRGAGGGPASPLSASMDSGISSAGRRAAPSPPDELDTLLGDMLRTVSALPDPPQPQPAASQSRADRPPDIPYHARTDSAPFTYGAPGLRPGMLRASNRLASPELVRRALGGDSSYRPIEDDDDELPRVTGHPARTLKKLTHEDITTTTSPVKTPAPVSPLRNGRLAASSFQQVGSGVYNNLLLARNPVQYFAICSPRKINSKEGGVVEIRSRKYMQAIHLRTRSVNTAKARAPWARRPRIRSFGQ